MIFSPPAPLYQLANQCRTVAAGLRTGSETREGPQKRTTDEYLRLAATLIRRSFDAPRGLSEV